MLTSTSLWPRNVQIHQPLNNVSYFTSWWLVLISQLVSRHLISFTNIYITYVNRHFATIYTLWLVAKLPFVVPVDAVQWQYNLNPTKASIQDPKSGVKLSQESTDCTIVMLMVTDQVYAWRWKRIEKVEVPIQSEDEHSGSRSSRSRSRRMSGSSSDSCMVALLSNLTDTTESQVI